MTEPQITCPHCKEEIKLTESLAAPLVELTRKEFEQKLSQKDKEIVSREENIRNKESQLAQDKKNLEKQIEIQVQEKLKIDRAVIVEEETKKAKSIWGSDLEHKEKEILNLNEILKSHDAKLAEAQKIQVEFLKKQRELADEKREIDLTIEKRISEGLETVRAQARNEAEESLKLKVMEKDHTITSMKKQIEELKRKSEQGSQQLQGEVQELELEEMLRTKFPFDTVEAVPKGEYGGDVIQRVFGKSGQESGSILWESKRTKNWSDGWLSKLRDDQRIAKAEISVLITQILPVGVQTFELIEDVLVTHPRVAFPLAMALRQTLLQISMARKSSEGQQTKMEMVYQYLTGPNFRHRVGAIVEAFTSMREDLEKERKVIMKQWAKRNEQIERVMNATIGMYGDLQGIAGKSLQEIEGLELNSLSYDDDIET